MILYIFEVLSSTHVDYVLSQWIKLNLKSTERQRNPHHNWKLKTITVRIGLIDKTATQNESTICSIIICILRLQCLEDLTEWNFHVTDSWVFWIAFFSCLLLYNHRLKLYFPWFLFKRNKVFFCQPFSVIIIFWNKKSIVSFYRVWFAALSSIHLQIVKRSFNFFWGNKPSMLIFYIFVVVLKTISKSMGPNCFKIPHIIIVYFNGYRICSKV